MAILLIACSLIGIAGYFLGLTKGRPVAGFFFSFFLGPIGWLLILIGPDLRNKSYEPPGGYAHPTSKRLAIKSKKAGI